MLALPQEGERWVRGVLSGAPTGAPRGYARIWGEA